MRLAPLHWLQEADRAFGPSLVRHARVQAQAIGTADAGQPIGSSSVRRLLVIRPGGIGDAVLLVPMLRALRASFPGADLHVLAERRNAGVFELAGLELVLHRYDVAPLQTWGRLRSEPFDLVIDTEQFHHASTLLANALRPRFLAGFDTLGRRRLQTHSAPYHEDDYEVGSFLRLAQATTGRATAFDPRQPFIEIPDEASDWADDILARFSAGNGRRIVCLSPAASGEYRRWDPERYGEIARRLVATGNAIVLLGGGDAVPAASAIESAVGGASVLNLAGGTTLAQTAAVLKHAQLSVSADTGVMHLAFAAGTPTVALFGPGRHRKWAPQGAEHRVVRKGLACSPCTQHGRTPACPHAVACMQSLTVDEVWAAIESLS